MSANDQAPVSIEASADESRGLTPLRVIGWFSLGLGVAAIGYLITREMRSRYKFSKRTPYDFYANGVESSNEYGVGV
jgi:hypothetical protein